MRHSVVVVVIIVMVAVAVAVEAAAAAAARCIMSGMINEHHGDTNFGYFTGEERSKAIGKGSG